MFDVTALIGAPASGKTTYAAHRWSKETVVLSLDRLRAEVCGDAADQRATKTAVEMLRARMDEALAEGKRVVVDATNAAHDPDRALLLAAAARFGASATAIVLDTPLDVCLFRNAVRPRSVPPGVVVQMHADINRLAEADLLAEGFTRVERVTA